jgi:kinesin family member 16B
LIEKDNKLEECHRKIEELHEKLKLLETENRKLLTQKSHEELERIQLKKQSMTLALKNTTTSNDVQTDTLELAGTETCDTFHTANSDCSFASALPSPFPPRQEHPFSDEDVLEDDGKTVMSDSGVCLENNSNNNHHKVSLEQPPSSSSSSILLQHQQQQQPKQIFHDGDNLSTNSSPTHNNNNSFYEQMFRSQMEKLREEIAIKKAEIMKSLEMGGEKRRLDEMINELQELQKDFVRMEMRMESSRGKIQLELVEKLTFLTQISSLAQMVVFRMAKCQQIYVNVKSMAAAALPTVTNHVSLIHLRCQHYLHVIIASRSHRAYTRIQLAS